MNRRQLLHSFLATSATALMPASTAQVAFSKVPARFQKVRDHVLQAIGHGRATGVSIAVVHRGQVVWAEGFGFADREHKIAATPDTPFCVASVTKTFTATLVTTLAAQGILSLDAPALRYLPATSLRGPNGDPNAITVRMLGAHSSGLPGAFAAYLTDGPVAPPSADAILHDYGQLAYPPGLIYEYGNLGFETLGAIVSGLSSQPFNAVMEQRLLKPLGLRNSFYSNAVDRIACAAVGYDAEDKKIPDYTTLTPPSGELYASAHDLARFALFYLHQPSPGTRPVLNDRWLSEMHMPVFTGPRGIATTFGWFAGKLATGEPYIFKSGGQPGVTAKIFILPSADLACVVLTNRTDVMPLVDEWCRDMIVPYVSDFTIPKENAGPESTSFAPTAEYLGAWKGTLSNGGADQPVLFTLGASGVATLALSGRPPQTVTNLQGQSPGFEGTTSGLIDCLDGNAFGSRTLVLKLVEREGKLCGRVTARGTRSGFLVANIPYVLMLQRA